MRYNNPMTPGITAIVKHKASVDQRLQSYLENKRTDFSMVNRWGRDVIDRLIPFVRAGKTIRGSLLLYAYSLFCDTVPPYVNDAAAALELFQAGFLIHDDIMDQDAMRRGKPSIHEQYAQIKRKDGHAEADHFGLSMGICAADICFFMGYELFSTVPDTQLLRGAIGKEMQLVGVAQMQDVSGGSQDERTLTPDAMMSLYRYKTARYTFSVPLLIGATLAHADQNVIDALDRLGESMGILFQIRDDELNVEGNTRLTGKPVGSDQRNGKLTLQTLLSGEELNELRSSLLEHAEQEIDSLPINPKHRHELTSLLHFCIVRQK